MNFSVPEYFKGFRCLAGDCKESCCRAGWEIPLDPETFEFYKKCGVEIEKNTYSDPDGDIVFKHREDLSCPYLQADGLCGLYIKTGGRLCEICDKYPRFFEEYEGFAEAGLSPSCPEARRLIFQSSPESYRDISHSSPDPLLRLLISGRKAAFKIISAEPAPEEALKNILGLCIELDDIASRGDEESAKEFAFSPAEPLDAEEMRRLRGFILENTEILTPRWKELLASSPKKTSGKESERRGYLCYLVYRYFLKAINAESALAAGLFISALYELSASISEDFSESVGLVSKEIEHNSGNVERLFAALAQ